MTQKEKTFETIVNYIDPSGNFFPYWASALKEHMYSNYVQLALANVSSARKSLPSLNITLQDANNPTDTSILNKPLFTIVIFRLLKESDLNSKKIKEFRSLYKENYFPVLMVDAPNVNDNGIKTCVKLLEKVRKELNLIEIAMIPYSTSISGPIYTAINSFFNYFKARLVREYNNILECYHKFFQSSNNDKLIFQKEDLLYNYISNKQNYFHYLIAAEFYDEIIEMCENDLYSYYKPLNKTFPFSENISFINFDEDKITNKLTERNLSNLEYQEFLFFYYIKSCRATKREEKINEFVTNVLIKIKSFHVNFKTMFHFHFWHYQFILSLFAFIKSIKGTNPTMREEDLNNQAQTIILYSMKKTLKKYALFTKIEIPSEKIFTVSLNCKDYKEISNEMNASLTPISDDIQNNKQFELFQEDLKVEQFDQGIKKIFQHKRALIEEYLIILKNLNIFHMKLRQSHMAIRISLEIIPTMFALSQFEEAKNLILSLLSHQDIKNNKWGYFYELLNFKLILLLNCLERNKENLALMLSCIDVKLNYIDQLLKLANSTNKNMLIEVISKYIEEYKGESEGVFNINKIISISFSEKKMLYINKDKDKIVKLAFELRNETPYYFKINSIRLVFEEKYTKKQVDFNVKDANLNSINQSKTETIELSINTENNFEHNSMYSLKGIEFILGNGIKGVYTLDNDKTIDLNVNLIDFEISSSFKEKEIYYNILNFLDIKMRNFPNDMSNKSLILQILDESSEEDKFSELKIFIYKLKELNNNIIIKKNSIEFPPGSISDPSSFNSFKFPFYVEDVNYYLEGAKKVKFTALIKEGDNTLYSYTTIHNFTVSHLFSLKHKFRLAKNNTYIQMQTLIILNTEITGVNILIKNASSNAINLDTSQALSIVLILSKDIASIPFDLAKNEINFYISNPQNEYTLIYPEAYLLEEVKLFIETPFHIIISVDEDKEKEYKVYEEIKINVKIKKYFKEKCLLNIKMEPSELCSIIGKSSALEEIGEGVNEINYKFRIFPLVDGFLRLPEIEFEEYEEHNEEKDKEKKGKKGVSNFSLTKIDFSPLRDGSLIEGNEQIIKVTSLNKCMLKLSVF